MRNFRPIQHTVRNDDGGDVEVVALSSPTLLSELGLVGEKSLYQARNRWKESLAHPYPAPVGKEGAALYFVKDELIEWHAQHTIARNPSRDQRDRGRTIAKGSSARLA